MAKILVDVESLQTISSELEQQLNEASRLMRAMQTEVDSLRGTWFGTNATTFRRSYAERRQVLAQCGWRMERFSMALKTAAKLYQQLDNDLGKTTASAIGKAQETWTGVK